MEVEIVFGDELDSKEIYLLKLNGYKKFCSVSSLVWWWFVKKETSRIAERIAKISNAITPKIALEHFLWAVGDIYYLPMIGFFLFEQSILFF